MYFNLVMFLSFCIVFLLFFIILKLLIEKYYSNDYKELIQEYHDSKYTDYNMYDKGRDIIEAKERPDSDGVDCIIKVPDIGVEIPVCKGNFEGDIEAFRLAVYNDNMVLGQTTYTVLGHHAKAMNIAFGWLKKVKVGMDVVIEQYGIDNNYVATDVTVGYANEMSYLFSLEQQDVVYLATCDYSLGKSSRVAYKVVKCERR